MMKFGKWLAYSCEDIKGFIYDYIDHQLPILTRKRFDLHIKMCKNCSDYFKLYQTTASPQNFIQENPIPHELKDKTLSFLEDQGIVDKLDGENERPSPTED